MKEQLINFETAKLAKEKGFNEWTNQVYRIVDKELMFEERGHQNSLSDINKKITAPAQSLLQKWLRETQKTVVWLKPYPSELEGNYINNWSVYVDNFTGMHLMEDCVLIHGYEEALEKGLQEALKLIKL